MPFWVKYNRKVRDGIHREKYVYRNVLKVRTGNFFFFFSFRALAGSSAGHPTADHCRPFLCSGMKSARRHLSPWGTWHFECPDEWPASHPTPHFFPFRNFWNKGEREIFSCEPLSGGLLPGLMLGMRRCKNRLPESTNPENGILGR